jgi:TonB family protein
MSKSTWVIFVLSLSVGLTVRAQNGRYNMKAKGLSTITVTSSDSADFYRVILPPDSESNGLFIVKDFYKNGKPKMTGKTTNFDPNKIQLEGSNAEFFESGGRKAEKNYVHNIAVGNVTEYFPNGNVYLTGKYDEKKKPLDDLGNPVGDNILVVDECRDSTDKVLAEHGEGNYSKYTDDFKKILEEGHISNGLEVGEWRGWMVRTIGGSKDTVKYVCNYENGTARNGTSYDSKGNKYEFSYAWAEPRFKGGLEVLYKYLSENIHYPTDAKKSNIQGKVFLSFVVDKDGSITDVKVIRGIGSGCDEEASRVLRSSPKWVPGKIYGIPVRVQYTLPISFTLHKQDD